MQALFANNEGRPVSFYHFYTVRGLGRHYHYVGEQIADLNWAGETWRATSIKHSAINTSRTGVIDETTIQFAVIAEETMAAILAGEMFNGAEVVIYKADANALGDPTNCIIEFQGEIDGFSIVDEGDVTWLVARCRYRSGSFGQIIPRRRFSLNCPWAFKGTECKYAGATPSCDHTATACKAMAGGSNMVNYGGFLWIPEIRGVDFPKVPRAFSAPKLCVPHPGPTIPV